MKKFLVLVACFALVPALVYADDPEDFGTTEVRGSDAMSQTGSLTCANVVYDFSNMSTGNTTVAAILAAFPASLLTDIQYTPRSGTGVYNTNQQGNALGTNSSNTSLAIIPNLGTFGNVDRWRFDLSDYTTEAGITIGDYNGAFTVEAYDGNTSVGSISISFGVGARFFSSDVPFNRFDVYNPSNPIANWVHPDLHICESGGPGPGPGGCPEIEAKMDVLEPKVDDIALDIDSLTIDVQNVQTSINDLTLDVEAIETKLDAGGQGCDTCEIVRYLTAPELPGAPKLPTTHPCYVPTLRGR
jgi:hypothetical protein